MIVLFKFIFENRVDFIKESKSDSQINIIKLPISEHISINEHFSIFSLFLNQVEWFLCHYKLEGYICSLNIINKGATQKNTRRGWMIICFKFFWKNNLKKNSFLTSYLLHLVCFEWFKTWWVHELGLYKNFFKFQKQTHNDSRFWAWNPNLF